jgi:hypothetical protein
MGPSAVLYVFWRKENCLPPHSLETQTFQSIATSRPLYIYEYMHISKTVNRSVSKNKVTEHVGIVFSVRVFESWTAC